MSEICPIFEENVPKQVYVNALKLSLKNAKSEEHKRLLTQIMLQVNKSQCVSLSLYESWYNGSKVVETLDTILGDLPTIFYDNYPKDFYAYLKYGIEVEKQKAKEKFENEIKYNYDKLLANSSLPSKNKVSVEAKVPSKVKVCKIKKKRNNRRKKFRKF